MMQIEDDVLTQSGLTQHNGARSLIIACGALAREILALKDINGWDHMDLTCLPAIYHVYPDKITDAVEQAVLKHQADYAQIFIAYADCGTGGLLAAKCADLGVELIEGPHCYSFFEGNAEFAKKDEVFSFFLTDFLVRQFDAFVVKPLGLDRHPELRDMYFGNYKSLVYQAQTDDPALTALAQQQAKRLGLAFERRLTGYGDLEVTLKAL